MLVTQTREGFYEGLLEQAAHGLHGSAFRLFAKHVQGGAKVLDLGSGAGAFAKRLSAAGYSVTACDLEPRLDLDLPYRQADLNSAFASDFKAQFDAVSFVEVIEHLENPRNAFRQLRLLVRDGGTVLVTTPNASGLYSRLRFLFTGQMAMFTDEAYAIAAGHITPLTAWQLEKIFAENEFDVIERAFHDAPFFPPTSMADAAKLLAWVLCRPLMLGTVGGQSIMYVLRKRQSQA